MENIATISFRDLDNSDEAAAIVRASPGYVAFTLTLRIDGDVQVVMPPATCDQLIAALSEARRFAKPS